MNRIDAESGIKIRDESVCKSVELLRKTIHCKLQSMEDYVKRIRGLFSVKAFSELERMRLQTYRATLEQPLTSKQET